MDRNTFRISVKRRHRVEAGRGVLLYDPVARLGCFLKGRRDSDVESASSCPSCHSLEMFHGMGVWSNVAKGRP